MSRGVNVFVLPEQESVNTPAAMPQPDTPSGAVPLPWDTSRGATDTDRRRGLKRAMAL